MRVVVTGGAGFIGANLVQALHESTVVDDIVVVDDFSTGLRQNLRGTTAPVVEGTVCDAALLRRVMDGVDAVVHLAAIPSVPRSLADPIATHHANATGTLLVLEAARLAGCAHVIVASSSSVYGADATLPKHEDLRPMPVSPYAVSKLATEAYALAYARCFGLGVLALRFFNVYGPLQRADHPYAAVIPKFVAAALGGQPLTVHGDGRQTRDFTYVGSVIAVLVDALARGVSAEQPVNLAFGTNTSLLGVIGRLEQVIDARLDLDFQPSRPGDVRHSQADSSRLHALFPGLAPVSLEDGLQATVDWYAGLSAGERVAAG